MKPWILPFFLTMAPTLSQASIEVAFLEIRTPAGKVLELEKGDRFAHVAISYRGLWLHAHPRHGVVLANEEELETVGTMREIVTVSESGDLDDRTVATYLGKPYDFSFTWDEDRYYCSELIGKILGLSPLPMRFNPEVWPESYRKLNGLPGLSPDKVYRALRLRGLATRRFN